MRAPAQPAPSQEKALLLLLALLQGAGRAEGGAAAAAQLVADAHGPATLQLLEEGWHKAAAAEGGDLFLQDLLGLSRRVRAAAAAALDGGGGPAGALGGAAAGGSREAHTEL